MFSQSMVRRLSTALVLAAALAVPAQASHGDDEGRMASRSAWVKVTACSRSEHSAVFYARMRRLAHGQRLWMRYSLLERGDDGRFAPVEAPGLGRWRKSKPGVAAFGWRQRVRGLAPDSAYRARVDYRWVGVDGEVDRQVRRRSGICSQSGPLANLRARLTDSAPTETLGVRRYTVRLANAGQVAAKDFGVRLAVEGSSSETKTVDRLAAGDVTFLGFRASECLTAVTAEADPADVVPEWSETDNSQRLGCADIAGR